MFYQGRLIYPENKRRFRTTNEEMYLKNYGSHYMAQSTAVNQFEQTFKINQGKMNLNTVYHNDFKKAINSYKERPVKREHVEARHQKVITEKLPMESVTQHKFDFKSYDPQTFSSVSLNNFGAHCDLFKSRLNKSLNPRDEEHMTSSSTNNFGCSTSTLAKTASVEKLPSDMVTYRNNRNIVSWMDGVDGIKLKRTIGYENQFYVFIFLRNLSQLLITDNSQSSA